jgi:hypothetical protein
MGDPCAPRPLRPFTVDHFRAEAGLLVIDSGRRWEAEKFQLATVEDPFAGATEVWWPVPEGNTKATLMAGVAHYYGDYRPDATVLLAASSRDHDALGAELHAEMRHLRRFREWAISATPPANCRIRRGACSSGAATAREVTSGANARAMPSPKDLRCGRPPAFPPAPSPEGRRRGPFPQLRESSRVASPSTEGRPARRTRCEGRLGRVQRWLDPKECAEVTQLAYRTVLAAIRAGELEAAGMGADGGPPYRIRPAALDAWHERRLVGRARGRAVNIPADEAPQPARRLVSPRAV